MCKIQHFRNCESQDWCISSVPAKNISKFFFRDKTRLVFSIMPRFARSSNSFLSSIRSSNRRWTRNNITFLGFWRSFFYQINFRVFLFWRKIFLLRKKRVFIEKILFFLSLNIRSYGLCKDNRIWLWTIVIFQVFCFLRKEFRKSGFVRIDKGKSVEEQEIRNEGSRVYYSLSCNRLLNSMIDREKNWLLTVFQ